QSAGRRAIEDRRQLLHRMAERRPHRAGHQSFADAPFAVDRYSDFLPQWPSRAYQSGKRRAGREGIQRGSGYELTLLRNEKGRFERPFCWRAVGDYFFSAKALIALATSFCAACALSKPASSTTLRPS